MATAYVTVTGTAAYPGTLGNPTGLTNALAGAGAGDTIYIAPGNYVGISAVTYGGASGSSGSPVRFIGDATGTIFSTTAGPIRITAASNISTGTGNQILTFANNSWIEWSYVIFDRITPSSNALTLTTCQNFTFSNCIFYGAITATNSAAAPWSHTFQRCVFFGAPGYQTTLSSTNSTATPWVFTNCIFMPINTGSARALLINSGAGAGGTITNCLFYGAEIVNFSTTWSTSSPITIKNCLFGSASAIYNQTTNGMISSYNRFTFSSLTGVSAGTSSTTGGILGSDMFESLLFGISAIQPYTSIIGSPNTAFGNATGAPAADMYGVTWTGVSPDAGPGTNRAIGGVSPYLPSERNAGALTIAPGATSQTVEVYLGATGLTSSTSGLSARYSRNRTASVNIPLVARTVAQAYTAGGFAEVDATNMPGVYRLDLPDAAVAAGADDVTVVVRGASGTNGAVLTIRLATSGLTSAQTASAVWGADPTGYVAETDFGGVVNATRSLAGSTDVYVQDVASDVWEELASNHTTAGTFGSKTLKTTVDNRTVDVGTSHHIQANIHAVVDDTSAADELKGALLHNGTDYISANLLSAQAGSPSIGPYTVLPSGAGADNIVDLNVGTASPLILNLLDGSGAPFNASGGTITANVYTAGGSTVTTYTGSIIAGYIGAISVPLSTAVTATSATYTMLVSVVIGTTTTVFGPLKLVVRAI